MKPLIIYDMTNSDYHASEGISKSGLDRVNRSPAHYKFSEPRKETAAMRMGTAIHTAILEPERFAKECMMLDACDDKRKSEYKDAVKQYGNSNVFTATESRKIKGMQESLSTNHDAMDLLNLEGNSEVSLFAECPETGALIKCRYDYLTKDGIAIDIKKTQDISPYKFSKSIMDYRYHVQEAFYRHVYKSFFGVDLKAFYFLAVEENAPHASKLYQLDDESLSIGKMQAMEDLYLYADCEKSDHWPYPDPRNELIGLPSWAINQFENDLAITQE